jgi:tetratricopeptide (TPR) repeat protein
MKPFVFILLLLLSVNVAFPQEKVDWLILNKEYNKALSVINNELDQSPNARLWFKKGMVMQNLQQYQEALAAFSEALLLEPENPEILTEMAESFSALGNYYDASPFYEKAVELDKNNLGLAAKLGRNYISLDLFKKAYPVYSGIYQKDSSNVYWNKQLAFSAYRVGRKDQSRALYEKIIIQNPRDYSSYFNLLRLYDRKDDLPKIISVIDTGLVHFPHNAGFLKEKAIFYFAQKEYENAKKYFEDYFVAGGDSLFNLMLNYGISSYFSKDEPLAISVLKKCESLNPYDPFVLFYLSLSHKKLGKLDVATDKMRMAIDLSVPGFLPEMYHHLGQIFGLQRKFEESIEALKKANELDPENYESLFEIATTYEEYNSNKTLALNYYRIYLQVAGESARNATYALERMKKIKEDLFFEQ